MGYFSHSPLPPSLSSVPCVMVECLQFTFYSRGERVGAPGGRGIEGTVERSREEGDSTEKGIENRVISAGDRVQNEESSGHRMGKGIRAVGLG